MALRRTGRTTPDPARAAPAETTKVALTKVGGKGRPTPSRASAEAARRRPLVPGDRREAAKGERDRVRGERARIRAGAASGDERYLTTRDRGPVRRLARDVVDARRNVGENVLIIAVVAFFAQLLGSSLLASNRPLGTTVLLGSQALLFALVLLVVVDGFLLRRKVRRAVAERHGADALATERGLGFYTITRSLQLRRSRVPGPGVARGQSPR